jgi:hypothetical protein
MASFPAEAVGSSDTIPDRSLKQLDQMRESQI